MVLYIQSMIGHCLGAAGGLEAIATVKAITTGWLHPTINQFVSENLSLMVINKRMPYCIKPLNYHFRFLFAYEFDSYL